MKQSRDHGLIAGLSASEVDRRLAGFDLYAKLEEQGDDQKRPGPLATLMFYPIMIANPFYVTAVAGYLAYQKIRGGRTKGRLGYLSDLLCVLASISIAFVPVLLIWSEYRSQQDLLRALQSIDNLKEQYEWMNDPDNRSYDI